MDVALYIFRFLKLYKLCTNAHDFFYKTIQWPFILVFDRAYCTKICANWTKNVTKCSFIILDREKNCEKLHPEYTTNNLQIYTKLVILVLISTWLLKFCTRRYNRPGAHRVTIRGVSGKTGVGLGRVSKPSFNNVNCVQSFNVNMTVNENHRNYWHVCQNITTYVTLKHPVCLFVVTLP